ncbi:hypothetical protein JAAARDRAFT_120581 [Jaapia argillacea MUCL 33604]|uniref:Pal1-domain-containing protein n=1 Tax=Jaapia argillacea MUCL 33604 TaxID=933084 RepID=A0A067QLI5_9AGAM|nr:hypothetical protein JAAARDRAFT_120581 [Jaapia argillacea MUCL 33604]
MGRSQTTLPPAQPTTRPANTSKRSQSQDSVPTAADKSKGKPRKKSSAHADVIDRLDYSGVGGPMFHHDGPFDACAPSRNRHKTQAPMAAWVPQPVGGPPPAQKEDTFTPGSYDSPYPSARAYKNAFSYETYEPPKKKVDVIAEAWGMHEPEPFEDFSAGGGYGYDKSAPNSIYNGKEKNGHAPAMPVGGKKPRDMRQAYRDRDHLDAEIQESPRRPPNVQKRSNLPPPQPIFVPDAADYAVAAPGPGEPESPQSAPAHTGAMNIPKRSKSLMQRIRKMRDAPNVPVGYEEFPNGEQSPTSSNEDSGRSRGQVQVGSAPNPRPTHRSQNSFLGRFGRPGAAKENANPNASGGREAIVETPEPYAYADVPALPSRSQGKDKSLPATPGRTFDRSHSGSGGSGEDNAGTSSLGRKTSLLKKFKGAVMPPGK